MTRPNGRTHWTVESSTETAGWIQVVADPELGDIALVIHQDDGEDLLVGVDADTARHLSSALLAAAFHYHSVDDRPDH